MTESEEKPRRNKRKSVLIPYKLKSNNVNDLINSVLIVHDKVLIEDTRTKPNQVRNTIEILFIISFNVWNPPGYNV